MICSQRGVIRRARPRALDSTGAIQMIEHLCDRGDAEPTIVIDDQRRHQTATSSKDVRRRLNGRRHHSPQLSTINRILRGRRRTRTGRLSANPPDRARAPCRACRDPLEGLAGFRVGATKCYTSRVKTISQRELRNDNAQIIQGVELGEIYTVTRRGVPVARLGPIADDSDLRCVRPAKKRPIFAELKRVTSDTPTTTILADLRGER